MDSAGLVPGAHISGEAGTTQSVHCSVCHQTNTGGSGVALSSGRGLCAQHSEGSSRPTWKLPTFSCSLSSPKEPAPSRPLLWPRCSCPSSWDPPLTAHQPRCHPHGWSPCSPRPVPPGEPQLPSKAVSWLVCELPEVASNAE